ncbi:MAG: MFS transporter, partial [Thermomicrobiales bacterium]
MLFVAFGAFGMMFGVWQVLLADLRRALDVSEGPLGLAITISVIASFPAMLAAGRVADRLGVRALIAGGALSMACVFLAVTRIGNYAALVATILVFLTASGIYDVGINASAVIQEQRTGRPIMSLFHAAFSAGGATGAIVAGVGISAGLPFRSLYVVVACLLAAVAALFWVAGERERPRPAADGGTGRASLLRNPLVMTLAIIVSLAFLGEGAMETWSSIYLRDFLGFSAVVGASGVAVFHLAMATGRATTSLIVRRLGRARTLTVAGALAAVGNVVALGTERAPLILGGFILVGVALSSVAPVALSLGGDLVPGRTGQVSAMLMTIGYAGFSIGPSVIGATAELASLRLALGIVTVVGLAIVGLAARVPEVTVGARQATADRAFPAG